ncbi:MAG: hypothetical protein NT111_01615 [Patescibacteria group bacterium]|jgi:hypothetical protein|nr:hypothetical protein [Patescibacteria group bacterium]
MENLLVILITLVSISLIILISFSVVFLIGLIKATKQVRIASQKVQESADSAAELVDNVRSAVVNPGVVALMIEKYLKSHYGKKSGKKR